MLLNVIETAAGYVSLAVSDNGVCGLLLPMSTREEGLRSALRVWPDGVESMEPTGAADALVAYFSGNETSFECPLDYGSAGKFDVDVWNTTRSIGYGETRTYGWIADKIGKPGAARAVGQALGRNPIALIVPCHRVVRADGGLGGFAYGLEWKERLLGIERRDRH